MNAFRIRKFLAFLGYPHAYDSRGWVQVSCPLAPWNHEHGTDANPSFGVRISGNGFSKVHCFSCNYSGDQYDLLIRLAMNTKGDTGVGMDFAGAMELLEGEEEESVSLEWKEPNPPPEDKPFPECVLDSMYPGYSEEDTTHVCDYLMSRDVPWQVAKDLDLRCDDSRDRVVFPIRDFDGVLMGIHGRYIGDEEDQLPYLMYSYNNSTNAHVWLGEHWVDFDKPVVMAESVFDLARIYQVYRNVVSPLTAGFNFIKLKRMKHCTEIITVFDADKAGEQARKKLQGFFLPLHVQVEHLIPVKYGDAGNTPLDVMIEGLQDKVDLDPILS